MLFFSFSMELGQPHTLTRFILPQHISLSLSLSLSPDTLKFSSSWIQLRSNKIVCLHKKFCF